MLSKEVLRKGKRWILDKSLQKAISFNFFFLWSRYIVCTDVLLVFC